MVLLVFFFSSARRWRAISATVLVLVGGALFIDGGRVPRRSYGIPPSKHNPCEASVQISYNHDQTPRGAAFRARARKSRAP